MNKRQRIGGRRAPVDFGRSLALLFVILGVGLASLIASYWLIVLEPRLATEARSRTAALVQAQAATLARELSAHGAAAPDAAGLVTEMDAILLIRDATTDAPFVHRIALSVDYDAVPAPRGSLDLVRGGGPCAGCFVTDVPLYHQTTQALVGIAHFHSRARFLSDLVRDVRRKLLWGGVATLMLIGFAWIGANHLLQRMRQSEANLRSLFEAAPFPMVLKRVGAPGLVRVNRAAIRYLDLTPEGRGGYGSDIWHRLERAVATDTDRIPAELEVPTADGKTRWALISSIPVKFSGAPARLICMADISPLKRFQDELREARDTAQSATRAKTTFLATMSHEIRTPLHAILGMAQLLADADLPPAQREQVDAIRLAGDALLAQVSDVLDFSQIESGRLEPESVEFEPGELIRNTLPIFRVRADQKGLRLEGRVPAQLDRRYLGDRNRIRQILINLLGNAVKFTERGGVTVKARILTGSGNTDILEIEVQDSGVGIPPEALPRLFDEFTQSTTDIASRFGGTGLGLAICRRLVDLLGGEIQARSTPGVGSTFRVTLPLRRIEMSGDQGDADDRPATLAAIPPLRVLVVDDEPLNRLLLRHLLGDAGHRVVEAENGRMAVDALAGGSFDLILMDLRMPVMDGLEAARHIRHLPDPRSAAIPIVALTADVREQAAAECRQAGINDVATKPVSVSDLIRLLGKYRP